MKSKETITIEIDEAGEVKLAVSGHAGKGCQALTKEIELAIGEPVSDEKTKEYYAKPESAHIHSNR